MTIEIVDFPIEHGGSFYSYVNVYQRLNPIHIPLNHYKMPWNHCKSHDVHGFFYVYQRLSKTEIPLITTKRHEIPWNPMENPMIFHSSNWHGIFEPPGWTSIPSRLWPRRAGSGGWWWPSGETLFLQAGNGGNGGAGSGGGNSLGLPGLVNLMGFNGIFHGI